MITGAVYSSPGIYLKTEENSGKPQLGDRNGLRPVIAKNGVPYLEIWVGSHSTLMREKKEGKGRDIYIYPQEPRNKKEKLLPKNN